MKLKGILIQVRDDKAALFQEHICFLEVMDLTPNNLVSYDLISKPKIHWKDIEKFDYVILGGAGHHSVLERYNFTPYLEDLIIKIVDRKKPFFGACYGFQFLAKTLGAKVVEDISRAEVGSFKIYQTKEGLKDPIFSKLPESFWANSGHVDHIDIPPKDMIVLAKSERSPVQAGRVKDTLIYGTQFHSELNRKRLIERLLMYKHRYIPDKESVRKFYTSLKETSEPIKILPAFLKEVSNSLKAYESSSNRFR